jgi:hypothetical protein
VRMTTHYLVLRLRTQYLFTFTSPIYIHSILICLVTQIFLFFMMYCYINNIFKSESGRSLFWCLYTRKLRCWWTGTWFKVGHAVTTYTFHSLFVNVHTPQNLNEMYCNPQLYNYFPLKSMIKMKQLKERKYIKAHKKKMDK